MKVNTAKQTMLAGNPTFGFSIGLGSALSAEILSDSGADYILLDRQHGSWGDDSTIAALIAMRGGSAIPMARVLQNDFALIGRLLDEGMMGIIIPMVNTADDAKKAADACRFPPIGQRSWGWGRTRMNGGDYSDWIDDQVFVAVQIETAEAVENAEAILATPGVDGCWVGPSDLSLSLGVHPSKMDESDDPCQRPAKSPQGVCQHRQNPWHRRSFSSRWRPARWFGLPVHHRGQRCWFYHRRC